MPEPISVLVAASEASPVAQTGGLAEVVGSLPQAFVELGLPSSVILPGYASAFDRGRFEDLGVDLTVPLGAEDVVGRLHRGRLRSGTPLYLIRCDRFFDRPGLYGEGRLTYPDNPERFAFFSRAVIEALPHVQPRPRIVMANDWQTGLIMPYLLEAEEDAPAGVFVIHNQGYLGLAPPSVVSDIGLPDRYYGVEGLEYYGQLSYLKAGIVYAKAVVAVSPSYAREIQTPEGGNGLDGVLRLYASKLHGIVNGVDYDLWNPAVDPHLAANYSAERPAGKKICKDALQTELSLPRSDRPLFGMVSRLTAQKGLTLIVEAAPELFRLGLDLVVLGTGEPWFEEQLTALSTAYPDQMRLALGYDAPLSHRIIAGSDFVLVPSIYEPCGLAQLYGLRYGAVPVVRAIGGLNDTVRDFAGQNPEGLWDNGFKFTQFQAGALVRAVRRAVELYGRRDDFAAMSVANMREDFSWGKSAQAYADLFQKLLAAD
ncbi:MAG: glycogen synthase GlgA [Deltaproteobacteria bacterium]|jgi:starch synthase|nr:glycogen synthase GlgA [Deltaproteobacteria bacterium]